VKLGLIGLPQSGKSTIFSAIAGARGEEKASRSDQLITTVTVPDERVELLTKVFKPKKTTHAHIEYLLPSQAPSAAGAKAENVVLTQARICDALLHVTRTFATGGLEPGSEADFWKTAEEMILSDLVVAEKRIKRMELDAKRGKKQTEEEHSLITAYRKMMEADAP